jgi:hypothetical protein
VIGTILNVITVAFGSLLGLRIGARFPERTRESVMTGLGLVTAVVGMQNALATGNIMIPLLSLLVGTLIGEALRLDEKLDRVGGWLQARFGAAPPEEGGQDVRARFIEGFVTSSLVFCIGPLTFTGSIIDGMTGDFQMLAIKSVLDLFASMAFASSLGVGVTFSVLTIIVIQGGLAVAGALAGNVMSAPMMAEMTATGGLLLLGLSLVLLDIREVRVANFLPALIIAPLLTPPFVALLAALGMAYAA